MDMALVILGALFILSGTVGSIVPILPGPPLAWVGLWLLKFSDHANISTRMLIITGVITLIITILDFILPAVTAKKYGGSKAASHGATWGTIIGIFFGPPGVIAGPFVGALVGELIVHPGNTSNAIRVAWGSFLGFLLNTGIKLIWCLMLAWWFIKALIA